MDEIDRHIVSCLVKQARSSFREIGLEVGLSAPAVKRRVDRLQDEGVITGFTAQIDPAQLGWTTQAFVSVTYSGNITPARIRQILTPIPEVVAAYTVSGDADVLVHLRAADMAQFEQALEQIRASGAVARTESTIVLSSLLDRPTIGNAGSGRVG
ncbi:Lrp/AsnC family transcriptional regulator [Nakamurella aerolata]|uniref:Lrp/AsnC family transcriptional regulator n=1 Tax=Nakamurella aerolata TaxID=1656892 RepID=A0A849A3B4_9ACTN|nr:Lrp/AsnC family transcriptional regulator [Nakamurella aerolata]NNG35099.1 Lrp/AsnC family transcriptional regulator [Nakamurella aerolata]